MADISLLFDVAGGSSLNNGSGKVIADQLAGIVLQINNKPFEIKFQADETSLGVLRDRIMEITSSLGNGGTVYFDISSGALSTLSSEIKSLAEIFSENVKSSVKEAISEAKSAGSDNESGKKSGGRKSYKNRESNEGVITEKQRLIALKEIESVYREIARLAAKNEATKSSFGSIANELTQVRTSFAEGKITVEEYDRKIQELLHSFALLKAKMVEVDFEAENLGNNSAKPAKLVQGTKEFEDSATQISRLINRINGDLQKYTAAKTGATSNYYNMFETDLKNAVALEAKLKSGTLTIEEFKTALSQLKHRVTTSETAIRNAGEATKVWYERVGNLTKKFAGWFSIGRIIFALYRSLMRMFTAVREIDRAMTELRKVTDATDAAYDRFLTNATKRAQKLGGSLTDIVSATADFARLGYTIGDAEKLADAAIVYKNVGDGIEDINVASESIIATMQAFGITAEEVMTIVDKFNDVGNKFAISSSGVGEALLRSAAAMKAANNTLDETIALATAANTIVQNPDTVGK